MSYLSVAGEIYIERGYYQAIASCIIMRQLKEREISLHQLAKEISRDQEIAVYESTQLYGQIGKYRFLQFAEDAVQGAIDLKNPSRIVLEYPRAMIHLMDVNNPAFKHTFIIGHGIGTIAGHYPDKHFTVAEIDEAVVELSRRFFHYRGNNVVIGDGRQVLAQEEDGTLDYIILDAFTSEGTPFHLTTTAFFELTRKKLHARGALIMNLIGKTKNDKLINAIHTTLRNTYACSKSFSLQGQGSQADVQNIILIGSHTTIDWQPRAMAGFVEIELGQGHLLVDRASHDSVQTQ